MYVGIFQSLSPYKCFIFNVYCKRRDIFHDGSTSKYFQSQLHFWHSMTSVGDVKILLEC